MAAARFLSHYLVFPLPPLLIIVFPVMLLFTSSTQRCVLVVKSVPVVINFPKQYFYMHYVHGRKEGNVLFNDALNTFYLRLYDVRHMVKNHLDDER